MKRVIWFGFAAMIAGMAGVLARGEAREDAGTSSATAESLPAATGTRRYAVKFKEKENPFTQPAWINGRVGIDWADVRVVGGIAVGTESGRGGYDDSTAVLAGNWPADQSAQATVRSKNQKGGDIYQEVELRLRTTIKPHNCTGYEINFRCVGHNSGYNEIVRWDGPLGKFTYLSQKSNGSGVADGDVIKATIVGNVITVYRNGKEVNRAKDDTFKSGSPGLGFYLQGGDPKLNDDYGFTEFSAE